MRVDDPIFSGSGDGRNAFLTITGSFTGSGHIYLADTASYIDGTIESASIADTASYVTSSKVDGPFGFDSIQTASYAFDAVSASYAITSSHATDITGSSVSYNKLNNQFKKVQIFGATDASPIFDFSQAAVFSQSLGGVAAVNVTFNNYREADVKHMKVVANGTTTFTLPTEVTVVGGGSFDTQNGITNVISLLCVDETTPEFIGVFLKP